MYSTCHMQPDLCQSDFNHFHVWSEIQYIYDLWPWYCSVNNQTRMLLIATDTAEPIRPQRRHTGVTLVAVQLSGRKGEALQHLPDVSRTGSAQEQSGAVVGGVQTGETHDVIKVQRNGGQVDSPGILAIALHEVGQEELTNRMFLGGSTGV